MLLSCALYVFNIVILCLIVQSSHFVVNPSCLSVTCLYLAVLSIILGYGYMYTLSGFLDHIYNHGKLYCFDGLSACVLGKDQRLQTLLSRSCGLELHRHKKSQALLYSYNIGISFPPKLLQIAVRYNHDNQCQQRAVYMSSSSPFSLMNLIPINPG